MKKIFLITVILIGLGVNVGIAQISDSNLNYLMVREDMVKPSRAADYEASLTDLALFLSDQKVQSVNYMTQLQDNFHYSHVVRLNSLNDIDGGLRSYVKGEKKSAEFDLIWSDLKETINSYRYYVVQYQPELSYVPDGKIWLEEAPYRRWNYLHFEPGTEKEAEQILLAWKNLYKDKGVKSGFRVFKGVVGLDQPVYMFTTWSATPLDYQIELQESIELLDDDGTILWIAMMELVRKAETVEGWYLPQYSFNPETKKK